MRKFLWYALQLVLMTVVYCWMSVDVKPEATDGQMKFMGVIVAWLVTKLLCKIFDWLLYPLRRRQDPNKVSNVGSLRVGVRPPPLISKPTLQGNNSTGPSVLGEIHHRANAFPPCNETEKGISSAPNMQQRLFLGEQRTQTCAGKLGERASVFSYGFWKFLHDTACLLSVWG